MDKLSSLIQKVLPLSATDSTALKPYFSSRRLRHGDCLVRLGQRTPVLALLADGVLVEYGSRGEGQSAQDTVLRIYTDGAVVGDVANAAGGLPAERSFRAVGYQARAYVLEAEGLAAARRLGSWSRLERRLLTECHRDLNEHFTRWRTLDARGRYRQVVRERPELLEKVPLKILAAYLNVAPATLSRLRAAARVEDGEGVDLSQAAASG